MSRMYEYDPNDILSSYSLPTVEQTVEMVTDTDHDVNSDEVYQAYEQFAEDFADDLHPITDEEWCIGFDEVPPVELMPSLLERFSPQVTDGELWTREDDHRRQDESDIHPDCR